MTVLETERLTLSEAEESDAPFVLALVNDPDWLAFIGDRGVRDEAGAARFVRERLRAMYAARGFGLWLVRRREDGAPAGLCGLIKRDGLDDVDLGFAFLPAFRGRGYAREAAAACVAHARAAFGLRRLAAITSKGNVRSIALLERLGFRPAGAARLPGDGEELNLFLRDS